MGGGLPLGVVQVHTGRINDNIIAAARLRSEQAWVVIYGDLSPRLAGYLRGMKIAESVIDDVVSETLSSMVRSIDGFAGGDAELRAWAYAIARNEHYDLLKKERRHAERRSELEGVPGALLVDRAARSSADAGSGASLIDREQVFALLSVLTERQREVMVLRIVGDLTVQQIAYVLGERVDTVKALQRRAVRALRAHLERQPDA